ncbi:MAG TPA: YggT family protein [Dehalococcoidia bacterium]|nr:YggT family protein [Dehalococcoidia bacterium]
MDVIIDRTILVFTILIFARVLTSWIPMLFGPYSQVTMFFTRGPVAEFLFTVTEPILAPIRSIMPRGMMIDLSPMIALLLIQFLVRPILLELVA